ncbi:NTP transferase domain-containing protein [Phycicoccus sp. BSK3Z-2]|uniref:NTP transferase domain-containing protein n=1 Tax=Phycicoccus avicenniae TaxID=2828860 RepID=A0A941I261_9MICO|nr:NTP transferase domain-containing protein [Phycicoccus avicenniae]MBR7744709.1 NTP transferase domain-containing protein [Phycicoccus avicenniae]
MSTGTGTGTVTVVVLAGGRSTRFGADKLAASLGGGTVLDHLLQALPAHWSVVAVGGRRDTARPVTWARERPAGAGPLAAVLTGAGAAGTDLLAVVAGDMPHAAPALVDLVAALDGAAPDVAAVVAVDDEGVPNPLLAAYRTPALLAAAPEDPAGVPARRLLGLPHRRVAVTGRAGRDVDTPADLAALDDDA